MIDDGSGDMRTPFLDKLLPRTPGGLLSNGICDANVLLQSVCPTETFSYVSYCIEVKYCISVGSLPRVKRRLKN